MKKKMRFIMPRLIGATVVLGIAAFIITTLFKLVLGVTILVAVVGLVARKIGRRKQQGLDGQNGAGNMQQFSDNFFGAQVQPIRQQAQGRSTIVPIN